MHPARACSLTHSPLTQLILTNSRTERLLLQSPFRCLPLPLPCTFSVAHLRHALRSRCHHRPRASAACAPRVRLCFRHCTHIRRPDDQSVRQQWCAIVSAHALRPSLRILMHHSAPCDARGLCAFGLACAFRWRETLALVSRVMARCVRRGQQEEAGRPEPEECAGRLEGGGLP